MKVNLLLLALFTLAIAGCKKTETLTTTTNTATTTTTPPPVIGQSYQGGIVFYVDGAHGLIAATADQGTGTIQWYNGNSVITNATSKEIGKGMTNTSLVVKAQSTGDYAAKICDDLVLSGYSDWFLPSKDELHLMYLNLKAKGLGDFIGGGYWSSSETTIDIAWHEFFGNGYQSPDVKSNTYYVRAVRAF